MGDKMQVLIDLIIQKAKARADLQKELKELQKDAQIETDVKVNLSDVKKARKEIEQANKEQQEGTRENIKLRAQELAHERMLAKEIKAKADVENAQNKLSKTRNAEKITALKQERQLLAETRKLENERSKKDSTQTKANDIRFKMDNGHGVSDYQNRIKSLVAEFERYGIATDRANAETAELQRILSSMTGMNDDELVATADRLEHEFKAVKISVDSAKIAFDKFTQPVSKDKATALINRINTFLTKNTAITQEAREKLEGYVRRLEQGVNLSDWNLFNNELKNTENQMRGLGKLGASLKNQMKQAAESFTQWFSVSSAIMLLVTKIKQAVTELKEVDTLLTEISKANDNLSRSDLIGIGDRSFETASHYGKKATDYLAGVQEMSRAGYQNAEAMGELSVKAQGAGDMTEDVANKFIVATDKAYKLNGSLTDLTKIMDGINYITNHNAINMTELSEGFSIVGSTAASFGVEANELTAALATMGASTQQSGSEVARAFRAILLNIRQVSDEEEGIDAEGLTKYENACNALNVKLKETKNGVQELRDPMEVLRELSNEYKKLSDTDIRKVNLLNAVGGKLRATQLDALLRGWEDYEKMLGQFDAGMGSMEKEAEKTANSWEGSMNRLSNTWTDTIGNIANSSAVTGLVNGLNGVLTIVNGITSALGTFGTVGLSVIALMAKNGITFRDVWTSITGGVKMNAPKYARHTVVVTRNELMMNMVSLTRLYVANA